MALTPIELANALRLFGVSVLDAGSPRGLSLSAALAALTPDQLTVFRQHYLEPLLRIEQAMFDATLDADTKRAGPWERNLLVGDELRAGYNDLLYRLGLFIGVSIPGSGEAPPVVFIV